MALAVGETVAYETRDVDGVMKTFIYRSFAGVKVDLSSSGEANLADAKTNANTATSGHKTAVSANKTRYNGRVTAFQGAATRTHTDTDNFGNIITVNEYDIAEGGITITLFVPSASVAEEITHYNSYITNIDLDRTHDDDLTTAINALS